MNVCSLTKKFDDFNILLRFNIIAVTESRIKEDSSSQINLQLSNYSIAYTATESSAGGTPFLFK